MLEFGIVAVVVVVVVVVVELLPHSRTKITFRSFLLLFPLFFLFLLLTNGQSIFSVTQKSTQRI